MGRERWKSNCLRRWGVVCCAVFVPSTSPSSATSCTTASSSPTASCTTTSCSRGDVFIVCQSPITSCKQVLVSGLRERRGEEEPRPFSLSPLTALAFFFFGVAFFFPNLPAASPFTAPSLSLDPTSLSSDSCFRFFGPPFFPRLLAAFRRIAFC
jgi:hypothetical protein